MVFVFPKNKGGPLAWRAPRPGYIYIRLVLYVATLIISRHDDLDRVAGSATQLHRLRIGLGSGNITQA